MPLPLWVGRLRPMYFVFDRSLGSQSDCDCGGCECRGARDPDGKVLANCGLAAKMYVDSSMSIETRAKNASLEIGDESPEEADEIR